MSTISNFTFYFNSSSDTFDNAEAGCNSGGGHLATYTSIEEQNEVEQYVSGGGVLVLRACRSGRILFGIGVAPSPPAHPSRPSEAPPLPPTPATRRSSSPAAS